VQIMYAHKIFVMKPEGKRLLGSPRHRWKSITKVDFKECETSDWINLAQVMVMKLQVP